MCVCMYVSLDMSQDIGDIFRHIYIQPPDVEVRAYIQHTYFLSHIL